MWEVIFAISGLFWARFFHLVIFYVRDALAEQNNPSEESAHANVIYKKNNDRGNSDKYPPLKTIINQYNMDKVHPFGYLDYNSDIE